MSEVTNMLVTFIPEEPTRRSEANSDAMALRAISFERQNVRIDRGIEGQSDGVKEGFLRGGMNHFD